MKKLMGGLIVGALAVFTMASTAHAGVITWDFLGGGANVPSKSVTSTNGLRSIDVSAWSLATNSFGGTSVDIRHNNAGLGVDGCGGTQINNTGGCFAEWIAIAAPTGGWSDIVIGLNSINSSERFVVIGSNTAQFTAPFNFLIPLGVGGNQAIDFYSLPASATNWAYILIGVTSDLPNSGFRVASISANVPEPATIALIGFGLVGMGLARRRRQSA